MLILFLLAWGMLAGWVAQLILGRQRPSGYGEALVAGLVGSFVGGLLISLISGDGLAIKPSGLIGSVVGALIVLLILDAIRRRNPPPAKPAARSSHGKSSHGKPSKKSSSRHH